MPYVGRSTDKLSNIEVLDVITFDGSSSYTLQKNSVNFTPSSANNVLVSIDGVVQANNFTVSGSTINFGVAVPSTSTCDWIYHIGVGLITTPADGTVTTAKLADSSVTSAKLSGVTQGITEADMWRLTADLTADASPISSNWERVDETSFGKIGTGMSVSSGYWTFPSTGLYLVTGISQITAVSDALNFKIMVTIDNSSYDEYAYVNTYIASGTIRCNNSTSALVNVTDTSNVKVAFYLTGNDGSSTLHGDTNKSETTVSFIRLGDSV